MVLLFWCRLTYIVLEKRSLNECSSSSSTSSNSSSSSIGVVLFVFCFLLGKSPSLSLAATSVQSYPPTLTICCLLADPSPRWSDGAVSKDIYFADSALSFHPSIFALDPTPIDLMANLEDIIFLLQIYKRHLNLIRILVIKVRI